MKSLLIKCIAIFFLLLGIFAYIMDQTLDEGRVFQSQDDYQLQAATLAYNPAIDQQKDMAAKQKLALLNNVQLYDFLARGHQVKESGLLANTLVAINDKVGIVPVEKGSPQHLTGKNAACHLLERKQRGIIPEAPAVYREYKHQFSDSLKLAVTEGQLSNIWQPLSCQSVY